jgi:predicted HAD superfamily phosphohydrolase YqeG
MIEYLLNYQLFIPDGYSKTIFDVDFESVRNSGIEALLIDVDNTLIPYDETLPSEKLITLFNSLQSLWI